MISISLFLSIIYCLCCIAYGNNLRSRSDVAAEEISNVILDENTVENESILGNTLTDTFHRVSRRLEQWNRFKSYQHSAVKPPMYAKVSRHHDVSEYLSPVQKYMVRHQKHNYAGDRFGNNWSGFNNGK